MPLLPVHVSAARGRAVLVFALVALVAASGAVAAMVAPASAVSFDRAPSVVVTTINCSHWRHVNTAGVSASQCASVTVTGGHAVVESLLLVKNTGTTDQAVRWSTMLTDTAAGSPARGTGPSQVTVPAGGRVRQLRNRVDLGSAAKGTLTAAGSLTIEGVAPALVVAPPITH